MFKNYRTCSVKDCLYCGDQFSPLPQQGDHQKTCGKKDCKKAHKKFLNSRIKTKAERTNSNKLWRKHNKDKIKQYNSKYYRKHNCLNFDSNSRVESQPRNSRVESLACNIPKLKEKLLEMLNSEDSRVESIAILGHMRNTVSIKIKTDSDLIRMLDGLYK